VTGLSFGDIGQLVRAMMGGGGVEEEENAGQICGGGMKRPGRGAGGDPLNII